MSVWRRNKGPKPQPLQEETGERISLFMSCALAPCKALPPVPELSAAPLPCLPWKCSPGSFLLPPPALPAGTVCSGPRAELRDRCGGAEGAPKVCGCFRNRFGNTDIPEPLQQGDPAGQSWLLLMFSLCWEFLTWGNHLRAPFPGSQFFRS